MEREFKIVVNWGGKPSSTYLVKTFYPVESTFKIYWPLKDSILPAEIAEFHFWEPLEDFGKFDRSIWTASFSPAVIEPYHLEWEQAVAAGIVKHEITNNIS